jgi:FMN phosphatase YigB (HAD superfamily)
MKMDSEFFSGFTKDLQDPKLWKQFHERLREKEGGSENSAAEIPPLPKIDGEYLFWEMMGRSRAKDPYIFPALCKLKASGQFLIGALSNTVIFPEGHPYNDNERDGLRPQFDFFVSSAHVGMRKPDPRVYTLALKEMEELAARRGLEGFKPDDIVFLDDIGENLKAGKKAGMRTLKVVLGSTQDAVKQLEELTGLQLLDAEEKARL